MSYLNTPQIFDKTLPCISSSTEETKNTLLKIRNTNRHVLLGAQRLMGSPNEPELMEIQLGGRKPAVVGYERQNGQAKIRDFIKSDYEAGSIITLLDHTPNPLSYDGWTTYNPEIGSSPEVNGSKDISQGSNALSACLPGGAQRDRWLSYLDGLAAFLNTLTDGNGEKIPVVLRPLHEQMGNWYWWHQYSTKAQLVSLWQDYVDRLRFNNVSNVLICWCTTVNNVGGTTFTYADYNPLYPGDNYCDMVGVDLYSEQPGGSLRHGWLRNGYLANVQIAGEHNKPLTIPEMGFSNSAQSWSATTEDFWSEVILPDLKSNFVGARWLQFWNDKWGPCQLDSPNSPGAVKMFKDSYWKTV